MSEMLLFNVDEGYSEALIRVLKSSFLTEEDYIALKGANNLVDFKTALETTDYEEVLADQPSPLPVQQLARVLRQKLADDMNYIQAQTSEPLYEFLNLMRHGHMIENTVYYIEGIKANVEMDRLTARLDPLGDYPGIKAIKAAEGENYSSVYQTVLIDLPVGKYFHKFLEDIMIGSDKKDINSIDSIMKDYTQNKIKNLLKNIWLTEMYKFCTTQIDGTSREMMEHLLKFESDCMTMQVIYNSLGNKELLEAKGREAERKQYIHSIGYLYPGRDKELTAADSFEKLKAAVAPYDQYKKLLEKVPDPARVEEFNNAPESIDDYMFREQAKMYALAFEEQFHYGVYYAYMKLKEQEIRNILWMADLVSFNVPKAQPGWKKIVVPFKDVY